MKNKLRQFAYFDTSVLAKRYLKEPGSQTARQLGRKFAAITSEIAILEMTSAARRSLASGDLDDQAYAAIRNKMRQDRARLQLVAVRSAVLESAEQYVTDYDLRALDAIHLASAQCIVKRFSELHFITADQDQHDAAVKLGLKTVWVE